MLLPPSAPLMALRLRSLQRAALIPTVFSLIPPVTMQLTAASLRTHHAPAGVQRHLSCPAARPLHQQRSPRRERIERQMVARAEVEQAAAAAATSSGEFSDSEVRERSLQYSCGCSVFFDPGRSIVLGGTCTLLVCLLCVRWLCCRGLRRLLPSVQSAAGHPAVGPCCPSCCQEASCFLLIAGSRTAWVRAVHCETAQAARTGA